MKTLCFGEKLRHLWDTVKWNKLCTIGTIEERKVTKSQRIFEYVMSKTFYI